MKSIIFFIAIGFFSLHAGKDFKSSFRKLHSASSAENLKKFNETELLRKETFINYTPEKLQELINKFPFEKSENRYVPLQLAIETGKCVIAKYILDHLLKKNIKWEAVTSKDVILQAAVKTGCRVCAANLTDHTHAYHKKNDKKP